MTFYAARIRPYSILHTWRCIYTHTHAHTRIQAAVVKEVGDASVLKMVSDWPVPKINDGQVRA
jgi:hypothetical protein